MGNAFDPVRYEEEIYKFEESLCRIVMEIRGRPLKDFIEIGKIASSANLPLDQAKEIGQYLEDMQHLTPSTGYSYRFTEKGFASFQGKQSKESPYTKRRERMEATKGNAKQGIKAFGRWVFAGVGTIIMGAVGTICGPPVARWFKELIGMK